MAGSRLRDWEKVSHIDGESIPAFLKRRDREVAAMKSERKMNKSSKAAKLRMWNAKRLAIHKRRLKLDALESKLRSKLRDVEATQFVLAEKYNNYVFAISQLESS